MSNFAEDIERAAKGEEIEAIVVTHSRDTFEEEWSPEDFKEPYLVRTWQEVKPRLDYEYDTGFGGADCHAIFAWTPTRIVFVTEYDGATSVTSLPRNPVEGRPDHL